ncbi:hypothetical protein GGR57DRAFT_460862 [Xylariaceae sp. FL1272]|nr:hypothetical protein GGR57DRAFT_460862 [Xylariaceae sp. FL1272]
MQTISTQSVLATAISLTVVITVAVAIRLWVRIGMVRVWGVDDILITISFAASVVHFALIATASTYGLGTPKGRVSDDDFQMIALLELPISIFYSTGILTAKASFAVLYLRLFPQSKLEILNKGVILFLCGQLIEEIFVVIFRCIPVQRQYVWIADLEGHCINIHPFWILTFVFNVSTDLILFLEPIPFTWQLQMALTKRIGILCMMSLGLLVTAISALRLYYVILSFTEPESQSAIPILWSATEVAALILCSCIPSLRVICSLIPGLNSFLGLSSDRSAIARNAYYGDHSNPIPYSIPLGKWRRKDYIQSQVPKGQRTNPFGPTTRTTATCAADNNSSQEDIFPHSRDLNGAIMVTREVIHKVES